MRLLLSVGECLGIVGGELVLLGIGVDFVVVWSDIIIDICQCIVRFRVL